MIMQEANQPSQFLRERKIEEKASEVEEKRKKGDTVRKAREMKELQKKTVKVQQFIVSTATLSCAVNFQPD